MRAGEHHPQFVVADRVDIHLGTRLNLVQDSRQFLSGAHSLATQSIAGAVARHGEHPSAGVVWDAVTRPCPQCLGEGFLDGVLGDGEIARPSGQRGHGRPPLPPKDAVQVDHALQAGESRQLAHFDGRRRNHRRQLHRLVAITAASR